jgi:hypothetical protein
MKRFSSEIRYLAEHRTQDAAMLHQPTEHQQVRAVADVHGYGNAVFLK